MTTLIDLSQKIQHSMPVYPGDSPVNLSRDRSLHTDGYTCFRLESNTHAGTHIDTPMHLTQSASYVLDYPLEKFFGRGCLLDVRGEERIGYAEEYEEIVQEGDIVLVFTGRGETFLDRDYFKNYPAMEESLVRFLITRNIKLLGLDSPSPDRYPFDIHKILFESGILIIENLTNLDALLSAKSFEIMAFPLKIRADASPVRVVARMENAG